MGYPARRWELSMGCHTHAYIHTYISGPCIHTSAHNRVRAYMHTVPICIHVYTAGYIYTHAHNRALHI